MKKQLVLGFSCGLRLDGRPTRSNFELIEKFISCRPDFLEISLVLQSDLAQVLNEVFPDKWNIVKVVYTGQEGKIYRFDTEEIIRQGIQYAVENGYDTIYILAHPILHRQFCWYTARKISKKHGIKVKVIRTGWIAGDPFSAHWWTRHPLLIPLYAILNLFNLRRFLKNR